MDEGLFLIIAFLFGLAAGSFLNAFLYRLSIGGSVVRGRSYCPRCTRELEARDLIPLVSFVLLRGRCRYCKGKISLQYPLVELGTGFLFLLSVLAAADLGSLPLILVLFVMSALMAIFVYDLYYFLIPDKILFPALGAALLYQVFLHLSFTGGISFAGEQFLVSAIAPALVAVAFFFSLFFFSGGKAMGFGDVKFALFMGVFLGYPALLAALFFAFISGGIMGVVQMVFFKKGLRSRMPFAPFLVLGTFVAFFAGHLLLEWNFPLYELYYILFL